MAPWFLDVLLARPALYNRTLWKLESWVKLLQEALGLVRDMEVLRTGPKVEPGKVEVSPWIKSTTTVSAIKKSLLGIGTIFLASVCIRKFCVLPCTLFRTDFLCPLAFWGEVSTIAVPFMVTSLGRFAPCL